MRYMGDALAAAMRQLATSRKLRDQRVREFYDAGGRCVTCMDTGIKVGQRAERDDPSGLCPDCEAGEKRLAAIRSDLFHRLTASSPVTPRALPLETMRCANAERVRSLIADWCEGWHVGWKQPTPHSSNQPFLILHGPTGSGKTSAAATAALRVAARQLVPPAFVNAAGAIDALRDRAGGRGDGTFEGHDALSRPVPLVVDDLGIASLTDFTEAFHYSVIHRRYEQKLPTIFTTNSPIDPQSRDSRALLKRIGDRSYWRLIELGAFVEVSGYNWRDRRDRSN